MTAKRLCKVLALIACGGVVLQSTGCETTAGTLLASLGSSLIPLALQILLGAIT